MQAFESGQTAMEGQVQKEGNSKKPKCVADPLKFYLQVIRSYTRRMHLIGDTLTVQRTFSKRTLKIIPRLKDNERYAASRPVATTNYKDEKTHGVLTRPNHQLVKVAKLREKWCETLQTQIRVYDWMSVSFGA